ncbi:MAG: hypothetical protein IKQ03_01605 [Prevotella sp.]|nr:hypothetical protein [Prevotella sp.]
MGDFSEKYSSWGGTNNVLVSSSQESEESSSKYNFADSNDNSSMNENVQENPYKYTSPDANSKIYVTNEYSQYVTKQWSQSQAAKRYSIQTPKVQNPRYNIQPPPTQMTEEVFKEQYKSTFEKFLEIFDTATGVVGDTSSGISGVGSGMTGFSKDSSLGTRIIQGIHSLILGAEKVLAKIRLNFTFNWGSPKSFEKSLRFAEKAGAKQAISEAKASSAANKIGYVALVLLFLVAVYRGCMWATATSDEEKEIWASKFRGALYNFFLALAVQALSKSHPVALIVGIAIAIMDAVFMYISNGECDFGYAFDLGLQWWGDTIKGWHKAGVDYFAETVFPYYEKKISEVEEVRQTGVEIMSQGFQAWDEGLHEAGETIHETYDSGVEVMSLGFQYWGDKWDEFLEWREENKSNSDYNGNDLPCWEVPGASAGL